jgi:hypothetical protein
VYKGGGKGSKANRGYQVNRCPVMCVVCAAGCANASVQNVEIESARGLLYLFVKLTREIEIKIYFFIYTGIFIHVYNSCSKNSMVSQRYKHCVNREHYYLCAFIFFFLESQLDQFFGLSFASMHWTDNGNTKEIVCLPFLGLLVIHSPKVQRCWNCCCCCCCCC